MRKLLVFAPEVVVIAVVAAILLFLWRPLPAKGAEFVVRPAAKADKTGFVVKAAPGPKTVRWQWWDAQGNTWFTDEPIPPKPIPPAPVVPAARPFPQAPAFTPGTTASTPMFVGGVVTNSGMAPTAGRAGRITGVLNAVPDLIRLSPGGAASICGPSG